MKNKKQNKIKTKTNKQAKKGQINSSPKTWLEKHSPNPLIQI
jgi:hypothetical protein